ncbi:hypothetical protein [Calorimonas adulescens]|uniref:SH3 domain-containing protein n=1 Tax=Calorimonas adulescens TaxID=2606906 RepID=A0A5D8QB18_9THEO|nr:hypothetical protein [Calorimonas adulescens]TZE81935.1 hypothetical protein FWJ32_06780 [Calorimonas adulescens]
MKRSILSLIMLMLVICIPFFAYFYNNKFDLRVFNIFSDNDISYTLVESSLNGNQSSLDKLTKIILNANNLNEWENETDVKAYICSGDILGGPEKEIIIGISLPPDSSLLSILEPNNGKKQYYIYYTTTDLAPINSIKLFTLPFYDKSLILLKETLDESFGAFFKSTINEIFIWNNSKLEEAWNGTEKYTAYWNTAWDENNPENKWIKLKEDAIISMSQDNTLISVHSYQAYMESNTLDENIPEDDTFKTVKQRKLSSTYHWDNESMRYIRGYANLNSNTDLYDYDGINFIKKKELSNGETVKLIQDLNELADNLINNNLNYYKVLTSTGLIGYISKEAISLQ